MDSAAKVRQNGDKQTSLAKWAIRATLFTTRAALSNLFWAVRDWADLKDAEHTRVKVHHQFASRLEGLKKSGGAERDEVVHEYVEDLLQVDAAVTRLLRRRANRLNIPLPPEADERAWQYNLYAGGEHGRSLTPAGETELARDIRTELRERRSARARVWTVIIAIATVAYAGASYRQWRLTKDQLGLAERQFAAVEESTRKSNQYFEVGQRAYLSIKDISILEIGSGSAAFSALCENTGKTPATNISAMSATMIGRSALSKDEGLSFDTSTSRLYPLLPPGSFFRLIGRTTHYSREEERLIEKGVARLYFAGKVEYEDVFGKRHKKEFCAFYRPKKDLLTDTQTEGILTELCPRHNSDD